MSAEDVPLLVAPSKRTYYPVIILEQLGVRGTQLLLFLSYGILFLAVLLSCYDKDWKTVTQTLNGSWTPMVHDNQLIGSKFVSNFSLSSNVQMMFSVCSPSVLRRRVVDPDIQETLVAKADQAPILLAKRIDISNHVVVRAHNSSQSSILFESTDPLSLVCSDSVDNSQICHAGCIIYPSSYILAFENLPSKIRGSLSFSMEYFVGRAIVSESELLLPPEMEYGIPVATSISADLVFNYNSVFRVDIELGIRVLLSVCTLWSILVFNMRIHKSDMGRFIIAEQHWISYLLWSVLLMQGITYIPYVLGRVRAFRIISSAGISVGFTMILITALLVLDSITATSEALLRSYQLDPSAIDDRGADYGTLREFPKEFYYGKILMFLVISGFWIVGSIVGIPQTPEVQLLDYFKGNTELSTVVVVLVIMRVTVTSLYIIWLFTSAFKASIALEKLPYMPTRFRQLAFRFAMVIMVNQVGYFVVRILGIFAARRVNDGAALHSGYQSSLELADLIFVSSITYIVAFVYSPASHRRKTPGYSLTGKSGIEETSFRFSTAKMLMEFSINSYFDSPFDRPEDGVGNIDSSKLDISHYGFELAAVVQSRSTNTSCFVSYSPKSRVVIVTFRGTEKTSLTNFNTNFWITRTPLVFDDRVEKQWYIPYFMEAGGVHAGYSNAYISIRSPLLKVISTLTDSASGILFTGHSMGGVLANLCAYDVTLHLPKIDMCVYTFGSPRFADIVLAPKYNEKVPCTYRVVCNRDIVTTMPHFGILYAHVGKEIFVDVQGNFLFQPSFVETAIRPSRSSLEDHKKETYLAALTRICEYAA